MLYYPHAQTCWGRLPTYDGMPISLGIVQMLIHSLRWGSVADKPRTSWCPSVSVADITDCATSPTLIYCRYKEPNVIEKVFSSAQLKGEGSNILLFITVPLLWHPIGKIWLTTTLGVGALLSKKKSEGNSSNYLLFLSILKSICVSLTYLYTVSVKICTG